MLQNVTIPFCSWTTISYKCCSYMCSTKFIAWTHTCMNMVPSVSQWELLFLQIHLLGLPSGRQNTACIQEWWYLPIHCKLSHQALKQLSEIQNNAHEKQQLTIYIFFLTLEHIPFSGCHVYHAVAFICTLYIK